MAKLIAPSILSADFAKLGEEVKAVLNAGADWIHIDVMDGHFVPNITIGALVVKCIRPITKVPLDVHLMIENPERYVADFAKAGADYQTVHIEATKDAPTLLKQIRELGCKPGITLKPATSVEEIYKCLEFVDLVLIMTVNPGFSGQSFMDDQVAKIKAVREKLDAMGSKALIEVDGGINQETAKRASLVDVYVAGNYIFKNDYKSSIATLKGIQ